MAFVARRNSQGQVVERRAVSDSGELEHTVLLRAINKGKNVDVDDYVQYENDKDADATDTETLCFSQRTYGAPTVRYMNVEEAKSLAKSAKPDEGNLPSLQAAISEISAQLEESQDKQRPGATVVSLSSHAVCSRCGVGENGFITSHTVTEQKTLLQQLGDPCGDSNSITVCQCKKPAAAGIKRETTAENVVRLNNPEVSDTDDSASTGTYDIDQDTQRLRAGDNQSLGRPRFQFKHGDYSSDSACSWSEMYSGALKPSESRSNIVPSLSLRLSETASSGSSTYYRSLNNDKHADRGKAAYDAWLSRKARQKQREQEAAKKEREAQEAELALRQRMSRESYERWCKEKQRRQQSNGGSMASKSSGNTSSSGSTGSTQSVDEGVLVKSTEEIRQRIKVWERSKEEQQQREREQLKQRQLEKQQFEQTRKQMSQRAWQDWVKAAGKRPKPVPLNQGFDTLRGTISSIYINPVPWVSSIDINEGRSN